MSTPFKKVALAGASGTVGRPVLDALLNANFTVTALSRSTSTSNITSPHSTSTNLTTLKVDFTSLTSLVSALTSHDALVITISITASPSQKLLIDAAIAAGVRRIIPSNFGGDLSDPGLQALPVFAPKVEVEQYLRERTQGTETSWTFIYNNLFLDWEIVYGELFLVQPKERRIDVFDGGERRVTLTPVGMLAKGIAAVLSKPDETKNKIIRIQGISMTKNRLLELAQGVVGKEGWTVNEVTTEELETGAWEALQRDPANVGGWVLPFLNSASWGGKYGNDFAGRNDNGLLGLEEVREEEVVEMIRRAAK